MHLSPLALINATRKLADNLKIDYMADFNNSLKV